jgi:hypothetical protein
MSTNSLALTSHTSATKLSGEVLDQIEKFKDDLERLLVTNSNAPPQMPEVLELLKQAEAEVNKNSSQAWHKLVKAKLLLQQAPPPSLKDLAEGETQILRQEVYRVWNEISEMQRQKSCRYINITNAANWLVRAETLLIDNSSQKTQIMYCLIRARYALAKAQQFIKWAVWGYAAILVEFLYLAGVHFVLLVYPGQKAIEASTVMTNTLLVPLYVIVWGFLGGLSWCIYSAVDWSKRRLFDKHYFVWYLAHPWLSAILGGAISLLVIGGLHSLGAESESPARSALLSLISFFAGFSTNIVWKVIDRNVRKLLGDTDKQEGHEDIIPDKEKLESVHPS